MGIGGDGKSKKEQASGNMQQWLEQVAMAEVGSDAGNKWEQASMVGACDQTCTETNMTQAK